MYPSPVQVLLIKVRSSDDLPPTVGPITIVPATIMLLLSDVAVSILVLFLLHTPIYRNNDDGLTI